MSKHHAEISKFLSYVLRHQPDAIGITLDLEGWADISKLIVAANTNGKQFDYALIQSVVATSDKKRFAISSDGLRIRAVQGHSIATVDLKLSEKCPPEILYHGTAIRFLESIKKEGLLPVSRQFVHLSQDEQTALAVGKRHGEPLILKISASLMQTHDFKFFQSENDVWLTKKVPIKYIFFDNQN